MNENDYKAIQPNSIIEMEARMIYTEAYSKALDNGAVPRDRLDDFLVKKGILTKEDVEQVDKWGEEIAELLKPLKTGGIKLKEMEERARKASDLRLKIFQNYMKRNKYDNFTAESQAEDKRNAYYIYSCFRKADGSKVWASYKDFEACSDDALLEVAVKLVDEMLYPPVKDEESNTSSTIRILKNTPEHQFLIKYKFLDENLNETKVETDEFQGFLDEEGNLIKADE